jgi:hypothetical protein
LISLPSPQQRSSGPSKRTPVASCAVTARLSQKCYHPQATDPYVFTCSKDNAWGLACETPHPPTSGHDTRITRPDALPRGTSIALFQHLADCDRHSRRHTKHGVVASSSTTDREDSMPAQQPNILVIWGDDIGYWRKCGIHKAAVHTRNRSIRASRTAVSQDRRAVRSP